MLALNNRPAAVRVCSNRRSVSSPATGICNSRPRSVQHPQHRDLHHHRLAAIPDEQNTGTRPGGPHDVSVGSDVPSSDTNPDMDPAEGRKYSQREEADGLVNFAEPGSNTMSSGSTTGTRSESGGRDVSDMIQDLSGGAARRLEGDMDDPHMTGTRPGGPHDVSVGSDVPSSDTNPDMDPAESPTYRKREEAEGLANANASGSSSSSGGMSTRGHSAMPVSPDPHSLGAAAPASSEVSGREVTMSAEEGGGFAGSGRDLSDMLNENTGASATGSSSSSSSRGHEPLSGSGSGVAYDAEEARTSAEESESPNPRVHPVTRTAGAAAASAAGTILGAAAGPVGAAAGAAVGAALGRRAADLLGGSEGQAEIYDKGEEPDQVADELKAARSEVKGAAHTAQEKASEFVDRASERLQRDTGGSSAEGPKFRSDRGIANDSGLGDMTALSADLGSTDLIYDTESGQMQERPRSSDSSRSKVSGAAKSAADRVAGATETAKDRLGSAAAEVKDKARAAAAAASERLSGAGDRAADAAASTARTAADYGAPGTSERVQEMSDKGRGVREDGEAAPGPVGDASLPNADWGSSSTNRDWGSAETVVKTDVGAPMGELGDISSLGAAAAAGGYGDAAADLDVDAVRSKAGGISGVESKDVGAYATRGLGEPQPGHGEGKRVEGFGIPEGRLAAGGPDAQAAVGAGPESLTDAGTSDSTAERVAQVYGVGPEASSGVEEANTYSAEADLHRKAEDSG